MALIVVKQRFTVTIDQLKMHEATGTGEKPLAQGIGEVEQGTAMASAAAPQLRSQKPALGVSVAKIPIDVASVILNIGVDRGQQILGCVGKRNGIDQRLHLLDHIRGVDQGKRASVSCALR